ncbi:MAG: hypothetical protein J0L69_11105 [Bacteroidetes bacterium]|nr:hypothetical protein [Bacteroidota bacterium]
MQNKDSINKLLYYSLAYALVFYAAYLINFDKALDMAAFSPVLIGLFMVQYFLKPAHKMFVFPVLFMTLAFMVFTPLTALVLIVSLVLFGTVMFTKSSYFLKLISALLFFGFMILLLADVVQVYPVNFMAPFLLSIIMFRGILLLYEFKHAHVVNNYAASFAYLFSFPQLFFPVMPIIDFKLFVNGSNPTNVTVLWQKAFRQFVTGLFLFTVYKISDAYSNLDVLQLYTVSHLFVAVLFKLTVLIKICGLFMFSLGFLTMFGIDLPSAFGFFPLAAGFRDYWKDVNRYWRDFLLKLIYYPLYFKLRKTNWPFKTFSVVIVTFLFSSFFHFYQLYLSSGYFHLKLNDIVYWMCLGFLVYWSNIRFEKTFNKNDGVIHEPGLLKRSLNVLLVQSVMSFLFFLWNCNSLSEFFFFLKKGNSFDLAIFVYFILLWLIIIIALFLRPHIEKILFNSKSVNIISVCFLATIIAVSFLPHSSSGRIIDVLYGNAPTSDADAKEEGYYAKLLNSSNNSKMGKEGVNRLRPLEKAGVKSNSILQQELAPNTLISFNGTEISTNSHGQRDKEYALKKDESVQRIAILGGSYEMGTGVNDEDVFEQQTEIWLNAYSGRKYELINFAVPMYTILQSKYVCENKIKKFDVDVAVLFSHTNEEQRMLNSFSRLVKSGFSFEEDFLKFIIQKSGVKKEMSAPEIKYRMQPYVNTVYLWCYKEMVNYCHKNNMKAVWVFIPTTTQNITDVNADENLRQLAQKAGFEVYSLQNIYGNRSPKTLAVSSIDSHPNALGHTLIAGGFYQIITGLNKQSHE